MQRKNKHCTLCIRGLIVAGFQETRKGWMDGCFWVSLPGTNFNKRCRLNTPSQDPTQLASIHRITGKCLIHEYSIDYVGYVRGLSRSFVPCFIALRFVWDRSSFSQLLFSLVCSKAFEYWRQKHCIVLHSLVKNFWFIGAALHRLARTWGILK